MKNVSSMRASLLAVSIVFLVSCREETLAPSAAPPLLVREVATPAAINSGEPELFVAPDGQIILSWIEKIDSGRHALRFAAKDGDRWSQPLTVAEGDNWFVNWADFPSVVKLSDNSFVAHWLVKSAQAKYAYDVRLARSTDGGRTWTPPITPHRDHTPTEHGFVSLVPRADNTLAVVWLDGRKFGGAGHAGGKDHDSTKTNEMTLRYATLHPDGTLTDETELDGRVCECCQTAAAPTADGLIVVYRDRSKDEVRDFSVVRRTADGAWTAPRTLHEDDWRIRACPVNGASVATQDRRVAVAWFTAGHDAPQIKVMFSTDSGATFNQPIRADDGAAHGRVDLIFLEDGSALVSWLEGTAQHGRIKARRIYTDGTRGEALIIAEASVNRESGFPRMARPKSGSEVVFAWTAIGDAPQVRTAVVQVD